MARIRKSNDTAALFVTPRNSQRHLGRHAAGRVGEQQFVVEIARNENLADEGLDEIPLGDAFAITGLDHTVVAEIIDEGAADLEVVVAESLAAARRMKVDVALAALVEELRAARFVENDRRGPHIILHNGLEAIEHICDVRRATD